MINQTVLENLILVRMLSPGKNGLTTAKIEADLLVLMDSGNDQSWNFVFSQSFQALLKKNLLVEKKGSSQKRKIVDLTNSGRQAAITYLGIQDLPPIVEWSELKNYWLVAKSLGLEGPAQTVKAKIKSGVLLQASIIAREHQLKLPPSYQAKHVWDALFWKCLGVETHKPFTLKAVQEHLLKNLTGIESLTRLNDLKGIAVASALKARRKDLSELRRALWQRLLTEKTPTSKETPSLIKANPSYPDLAALIKQAAKKCETGLFGSEKVFISHVWKKMVEVFPEHHCSLEHFKQVLVELNRRSLIDLCRADLIEALDKQDLSESLLSDLGSSFHFIRLTGV